MSNENQLLLAQETPSTPIQKNQAKDDSSLSLLDSPDSTVKDFVPVTHNLKLVLDGDTVYETDVKAVLEREIFRQLATTSFTNETLRQENSALKEQLKSVVRVLETMRAKKVKKENIKDKKPKKEESKKSAKKNKKN